MDRADLRSTTASLEFLSTGLLGVHTLERDVPNLIDCIAKPDVSRQQYTFPDAIPSWIQYLEVKRICFTLQVSEIAGFLDAISGRKSDKQMPALEPVFYLP